MRIVELTSPDGRPIAIRADAFRTAAPSDDQTRITLDTGEEITVAEAFDEVVRAFRALDI
jgi:hypothetical protein